MTLIETLGTRSTVKRVMLLFVLLAGAAPGVASAWWNAEWAYRKQIIIDAGATGADLKGNALGAPVLLRLHEGVFPFADANQDGTDLRFVAEDDKTPLMYHVEKFDPVFNLAFVWIHVPQVSAGAQTKIWMYYGNAKATGEAAARDTYDASQTLVYHFGERGTPPADVTGFRNNATSVVAINESGIIGSSAKFDGQSVLGFPASPSPSLAIPAAGTLTWSAWIKPSSQADAVLYAQRDGPRALIIGLAKGAPYVAVSDDSGTLRQSPLGAPLAANSWTHLGVIAGGTQIAVYVGGEIGPVLAAALPILNGTATVAGERGQVGAPILGGFIGEIDELQISKIARDPVWLSLSAKNQGTEDRLIQFGADEQASSWSTGYVGIIMGSVTLDGWIVIGILVLMMFYSWIVMAQKGSQIGRVGKANRQFLTLYRAVGGDLGNLRHLIDGTATLNGKEIPRSQLKLIQKSPLLHMFNTGVEELHSRLSGDSRVGMPKGVLSAQSIEAIRASIEADLVREQQTLSAKMVLLTIAISGGPFLGLLGTVVGVMITFAGVAAAGEVNVNAIAPGISAALAATVAGMAVAIPALFGYNYLITRIKEVVVDMQVFVNTFITRMAENYDKPAALHAMAD